MVRFYPDIIPIDNSDVSINSEILDMDTEYTQRAWRLSVYKHGAVKREDIEEGLCAQSYYTGANEQ